MKKNYLILCFALSFFAKAQTSILPTDGLIVHFPFTNLNNLSGGYNGINVSNLNLSILPTIAGSYFAGSSVPSNAAYASNTFAFSPSNSNGLSLTGANAITASNFTIPGSAFTISFWINTDSETDGISRIITGKNVSVIPFFINTNRINNNGGAGKITFIGMQLNNTGTGISELNYELSVGPLPGWKYVTYTWSDANDQAKLFVNGTLVSSVTSTVTIGTSNSLEMSSSAPSRGFKGMLDEISIYSKALSDAEVKTLYNRCAPITEIARTVISSSCASIPAQYAITLSGSALNKYWAEVVIGQGGDFPSSLPGANTNAISVPMPTTTTVLGRLMRYIASNECVTRQAFDFNILQTTALTPPANVVLATVGLVCTQNHFILRVNGDNMVNATYNFYKAVGENIYILSNTPAFSNQFTILLNSGITSPTNPRTDNWGTYIGVAMNACGSVTTAGLNVFDKELEFTGVFQPYSPVIGIFGNYKFYSKTISGVSIGNTVVLDAGIAANFDGLGTWKKDGVVIYNPNQIIIPGPRPDPDIVRLESTESTITGFGTYVITITNFANSNYGTYTLETANTCKNAGYVFDFALKGSGGVNTTTGTNSSLADTQKIEIYPNPSQGIFTLVNNDVNTEYALFDSKGNTVNVGKISIGANKLDFTVLPKGFYLLSLSDIKHKLVIE